MKRKISALLFMFLGLSGALRAQFIGYTSLQTVQVRLLNAVTTPTTANVPNLGQTVHSLTYSAVSCTGLDIRLEGSNDGSTFFTISTDANDTGPNPIGGVTGVGGVTAVGYFPIVRVNLAAVFGAGCAVTAFYSGTSTIAPSPTQVYQQASGYRFPVTLNTVTSNPFTTIEIPTPFGNTQGSVWVQCNAAGVATNCTSGGVLSVNASPADTGLGTIQILSHAIASTGPLLQRFDIPGYPSNRIFVSLTPTAASTNTWSIFYNFSGNPQPYPSLSLTNGSVLTSNASSPFGVLACESFTPVNTTASVLLVTGSAGQFVYICSVNFVVSAADNIAVVEGTGATCGGATAGIFGGATAATGWNLTATNAQVSFGSGLGMIGKTGSAGNNVCLLVSAASQVSGGITFTKLPQ